MTSDDSALGGVTYPRATTSAVIAANIARVQARIAAAAERSGRAASDVRLLPVSKTVEAERITWAHDAGVTLVGENKAQEARSKHDLFSSLEGMQWAMIGHLQSNKVKDVVGSAIEFHALESLKIAEALERRLQAANATLDVFVQVNSSSEASKYGLEPEEVPNFVRDLEPFHSLRVRGLMTLALFSTDADAVRACFVRMRELRDRLRQEVADPSMFAELSMGMSGDYEMAVEEGATTVRVGQAIFGGRTTGPTDYWPGVTSTHS